MYRAVQILIETATYHILPNKGAGHSGKVASDSLKSMLGFQAFQRWFWIENRTIIKGNVLILVSYDKNGPFKL